MKGSKLKGSVKRRRTRMVDNDEFDASNSQQHWATADYFEQRSKVWVKLSKGDVWIAIGIYLVMASIAFVVI